MGAPVVHWEINSKNAGELQRFYSKLFGWNIDSNNPMSYGLVMPGGKRGIGGGIGQNDPSQPAPPPVTFYMEVSDLEETLNQAIGMGGSIVVPPTEIPNMVTFALFKDPEGNTLGIVKAQEPQPKKAARKKAAPRKKASKAKKSKAKAKKTTKRRL